MYKQEQQEEGKDENDIEDSLKENMDLCVKHWEMSGKLKRLFNLLADWNQQNQKMEEGMVPNKVLIFSRTKKMLNVIE